MCVTMLSSSRDFHSCSPHVQHLEGLSARHRPARLTLRAHRSHMLHPLRTKNGTVTRPTEPTQREFALLTATWAQGSGLKGRREFDLQTTPFDIFPDD